MWQSVGYFILLRSGAALEASIRTIGILVLERQVAPVDARQPFDQALRKPAGLGLLLLAKGYTIRGERLILWVKVL